MCLLFPLPVHSGSDPGPQDCIQNVTLVQDQIFDVPVGTVCILCVFNGMIATDSVVLIDTSAIDSDKARVVDGILVVFNTENVFSPQFGLDVSCESPSQGFIEGSIRLMGESYHVQKV